MANSKDARETPVKGRLPRNLAEAPDMLTMDQAASATGYSIWTLKAFEKNDPDFPKRITRDFSRTRRFRKAELVRWVDGTGTP